MGFGKNLKESLKYHGITVVELSKRTGIPSRTLYSIISRDSGWIKIDVARKIEDAIGDPEYPLFTAEMDFFDYKPGDELIYLQSRIPDDFRLIKSGDGYNLIHPDGKVTHNVSVQDLNTAFAEVMDFLAYKLEKLKEQ